MDKWDKFVAIASHEQHCTCLTFRHKQHVWDNTAQRIGGQMMAQDRQFDWTLSIWPIFESACEALLKIPMDIVIYRLSKDWSSSNAHRLYSAKVNGSQFGYGKQILCKHINYKDQPVQVIWVYHQHLDQVMTQVHEVQEILVN